MFVCALLGEHLTRLLCDTDEGGSLAQLFEFGGAHVGAGGSDAPQHIADGVLHISSVGNLHRLPLGSPESRGENNGLDLYRPIYISFSTHPKLFILDW